MTSGVRPTVQFDQHSGDHAQRWREELAELRTQCPVAWTESHGGFWVLTRYADVLAAARDTDRLSNEHDVAGYGHGYGGIAIPSSPMRAVPLEMDPPESLQIRALLNRAFSPAAAKEWTSWLQESAHFQIDQVIESGEMDLIYDLGAVVPGRFTMKFLGLDESHWRSYALPFHNFMSPPDSEQFVQAVTDLMTLGDRLAEHVADRRRAPRDDFISYLTQAEVDGETLSPEMVTEMCFLIVAGGVDTTTSLFGDAVEWLSRNPAERDSLVDGDGTLLTTAIEEFLRYFSPTQGTARTVSSATSFGDQSLCPGNRVLLSWASANQDPDEFEEPDIMKLDRFPNRHTAFGMGVHRCLGSHVARIELQVMLGALLERIPDFEVIADQAVPYASIGTVNGFLSLPTRFTPAERRNLTT